MTKALLRELVWITIVLAGCSDQPRTFQTYEVNPLKKAYARNEIVYYLKYVVEGDTVLSDSVSVDKDGNILSDISKQFWHSERHFRYDSLGRLVDEKYKSDIYVRMLTDYVLCPEENTVVKYIRNGHYWSEEVGQLLEIQTLLYDDSLKRILKKTEVNIGSNDSIVFLYEYDKGRVLKEIEMYDSNTEVITEYYYDENHLIGKKKELGWYFCEEHYMSPKTGLIDSTRRGKLGDAYTIYYKYYKRGN